MSLYSVQTWEPARFRHGVGNKPTLPDFIGSQENDYGEPLFGGSKPLPTVVISYEDYGEDEKIHEKIHKSGAEKKGSKVSEKNIQLRAGEAKYLQDLKKSISKIQNGGTKNMTFKTETKNDCLSICKNNDIFRVRIVLKKHSMRSSFVKIFLDLLFFSISTLQLHS